MANETWKFVQAKSKQAMKQVLGIKNEAAHEGNAAAGGGRWHPWRMGTTCDGIRTTTALISTHKGTFVQVHDKQVTPQTLK